MFKFISEYYWEKVWERSIWFKIHSHRNQYLVKKGFSFENILKWIYYFITHDSSIPLCNSIKHPILTCLNMIFYCTCVKIDKFVLRETVVFLYVYVCVCSLRVRLPSPLLFHYSCCIKSTSIHCIEHQLESTVSLLKSIFR